VTTRSRLVKRALDLAIALPACLVLLPVMLVVAFVLRLSLGAPVLFRQERLGMGSRPFTVLKFRTMTDARDSAGALLPDAGRVTGVGRFLRDSSLDQLPELINVIRGDMSLVGPRPLLSEYRDVFTPTEMRRHEVPPGMSGWAQINGRNLTSWEERLALDVWYVDHRSLGLDIKILLLTVPKVLRSEAATPRGRVTMPTLIEHRARRQDR